MENSIVMIWIFFLMLQFGLNRGLNKFMFEMDDTLQGYKCLDEKITFEMTSGKSVCALRCWMDLACSSMIYYPDTGKCTGFYSFTGVTGPSRSNSLFYKRKYHYIGCYVDCPTRIVIDFDLNETSSQTTEGCVTRCQNMDASFSLTECTNAFVVQVLTSPSQRKLPSPTAAITAKVMQVRHVGAFVYVLFTGQEFRKIWIVA